ncbi:cytochrome P450 [Glonium stellatum]|uniref:Cytochrome P450 n=1 Tax=Glonium stellatum TaxID=574774 RepID=A0A8E2F356_9PEZI|nr:cytochrome P450 [Glonium stellatum]
MLWRKVYVLQAEELTRIIYRQPKDYAFYPLATSATIKLLDLRKTTANLLQQLNHDGGNVGPVKEFHGVFKRALLPGPSLDTFVKCALEDLKVELSPISPVETSLRQWVDVLAIRVGTAAIWGPKNPFRVDPTLIEAFRKFDDDCYTLYAYPLPRWTATGVFNAREKLCSGFAAFYYDGGIAEASEILQRRFDVITSHGVPVEETARLDLALVHGLLTNTVPVTLWMFHHIFSNELLLEEIYQETRGLLNGDTIAIKDVREKCPLLVATWFEVLRLVSGFPSLRTTLRDTTIKNKCLLKRDAYLVISGVTPHRDPEIWGEDVSEFNPRRYLNKSGKEDLRGAVRPFGGGPFMCPGRFLAFAEVMSIVVTVVLHFQIKTADGRPWTVPKIGMGKPSLGMHKPASDLDVIIMRRSDYKYVEWKYDLGDLTMSSRAF